MTKTQKTLENKTGISIQASPDKVWEVLVDLEHYEDWNPLFVKARGTLAEGEILQIKTRLPVRMFCGAPMTRNWTSRVTKVLPNNSLEWFTPALMNGFLDGTHFFQLTASSDGQTTEFVQGERYEGWGTGFFAGFGTLEDARLGFAVMNRALKLEVLRRLSEGELVATDDGTTTVVALSTHGDMKEKGGGEDVHNTNTTATTTTTTISSAAVDEKGGANKGTKGAAVTRSAAAEEEEEEEEDDDDAEETIEVVGVRGRTTAAKSGDDEEDEDDEEEDEDTDDDDDDDAENNTSQRKAAVQGLDISDRHAVDAARAAAATTSSPLTTSTESSSPPAQGHGKRRSLVERISMFSVQSASSPASVHNNSGLHSSTAEEDEDEIDPSRTSTSRPPRLHTQEAGEEEGEQQHDRLFDRPPPQLQLQFQPRSSLSHDGGGAGGAEEAKLSKADSKPFQLGLDLSLGSGLDFTF
ncbi:hypothetical protein DFQ26_006140 [Actinomortierella ambigua]|nr:hypothetical protein DFQ26_006140 [Actinomortierella ambigua]